MTGAQVAAVQREQDRQEAEAAALEAAAVASAVAVLTAALTAITGTLKTAFRLVVTDPARWLTARRVAARTLRSLQPRIASQAERMVSRAAALGARHVDAPLPDGYDPATDPQVRDVLDALDQAVTRKLDTAADAILSGPVNTPARLDDAIGRVDAARKLAASTVEDVVATAITGGARAAADEAGIGLTVWAERDACLSCQSMCGAEPTPEDGLLRPVHEFTARILPWLRDGVTGPPFHRHCRCRLVPATPGLAEGLRREAEREVARGESAYDSLPARLAAVDRVLRVGTRLPKSVRERAARDRARGQFSRRDRRPA